MFDPLNFKSVVVGAGVLLGAAGIAANDGKPTDISIPNSHSTALSLIEHASMLSQSSRVERLSGPLKDVLLPVYDGPVRWGNQPGMANLAFDVVFGALASATVTGLMCSSDDKNIGKKIMAGGLIGACLGAGLGVGVDALPTPYIQFETVTREVMSASSPHMKSSQVGKYSSTTGPYFPQVISIPEADTPLAIEMKDAPLIPGEKLHARFFIDRDNHIISWYAEPANR